MSEQKPCRMPWEKHYIEALIDALHPSGRALEVGFGLGYSATRIQTYQPQTLTIIESDPEAAKRAIQWASQYSNVSVIQETWQNTLPKLGHFDAIFFNDSPLETQAQMKERQETCTSFLSRGKEMFALVDEKLPQLKSMHYSDQDLDEFYQQVGVSSPKETARFLSELKSNRQISEEQYEQMIQKYHLERENLLTRKQWVDPVLIFLQACLKNHMVKGSRFSCFSNHPFSKFEDPQFFEQVITNPDIDYHESLIPITVPKECEYYAYPEALVLVLEKMV
jgi:hypothetical protein